MIDGDFWMLILFKQAGNQYCLAQSGAGCEHSSRHMGISGVMERRTETRKLRISILQSWIAVFTFRIHLGLGPTFLLPVDLLNRSQGT